MEGGYALKVTRQCPGASSPCGVVMVQLVSGRFSCPDSIFFTPRQQIFSAGIYSSSVIGYYPVGTQISTANIGTCRGNLGSVCEGGFLPKLVGSDV